MMREAMAAGQKIANQKKGCLGILLLLLFPVGLASALYALCT
jgi:hypothetical protein